MKTAIFPGSFNPFHKGHEEIISKALKAFNKVILAVGINPEKNLTDQWLAIETLKKANLYGINNGCIEVVHFNGLLADYVNKENENVMKINAVIRGLRNTKDFEYEKDQMYWNNDLGIGIPTVFFIAGRELTHVSSSAIRAINKIGAK